MKPRIHTNAARRAAIADYLESGDTISAVAARHGVARSTLGHWTAGLRDGEGLTNGRWVLCPRTRVQRWQEFITPTRLNMTDRERHIEWEDAMFDEDEARMLHARFANGCREERTVVGERVYQRRIKRDQRARKGAA